MKASINKVLDRMQRAAGRSPSMVRMAVLIRNQCRCIIKYRLAESPDVNETGEVWLRELFASTAHRVVDVGANIGDWLDEVLKAHNAASDFQAIAFEPSSSAFALLRQRFGSDSRVDLREIALGDRNGTVEFFEEGDAGKGSSIVADFNPRAQDRRIVQVATLDDEISTAGWDSVDFLKVDAEGYDLRVLHGAARLLSEQKIGVVQFEYNRGWQLAGDTLFGAMKFLREFGYDVYVLKRDGLYGLNYHLYEEYYEYSNYAAFAPKHHAAAKSRYRGQI